MVAHGDILTEYTQNAVLKNPEVLSRWHAFKAATEEIGVARGAYFPQADLTAGTGKERLAAPPASYEPPVVSTFHRSSTSLTISQTLYDGFSSRDEVRRLNHVQLARYYELLDATENAALDAVRAYYDLLRNRRLLELSQDNFVYHRTVFEQIQMKVRVGVGRRVDLEQVAGRLSLSEANMVLDNASVHDVNARFLRIVGEAPPKSSVTRTDPFSKLIPANAAEAHIAVAIEFSPLVLAAVENVRAAKYDLDQRRAKYQPKLDLRISQSIGQNLGGTVGTNKDSVAELVMNWNLFSGGSDVARSRMYLERLNSSKFQRDKACRDVRQTMDLAYHNIGTLTEQLVFIEQQVTAIEKARIAYKKQFDLGQRTLLDLLDTENELFQAKRTYTNAEFDLSIARARTLAAMGKLVSSLGLSQLDTSNLSEMLGATADAPETCPPDAALSMDLQKNELMERAREAIKPINPSAPAATPEPGDAPPTHMKDQEKRKPEAVKPLASLSATSSTDEPVPANEALPAPDNAPASMIERWARNWSEKNVAGYLSHYDASFRPEAWESRAAWEADRRRKIGEASSIKVELKNLKVTQPKNDKATAIFTEVLEVGDYNETSEKRLKLIFDGNAWKIQEEKKLRKRNT